MPVNQCVRSSSKLPRLGGSTKRHFPVWSTTQGTQLGVESHTYQCIASIHRICTICVETTWHHNITLQHIIYLIDSEEPTQFNVTNRRGHMTQHSEHTSIKRKLHVWVQTSTKSGWKSLKATTTLPQEPDHCLGSQTKPSMLTSRDNVERAASILQKM